MYVALALLPTAVTAEEEPRGGVRPASLLGTDEGRI